MLFHGKTVVADAEVATALTAEVGVDVDGVAVVVIVIVVVVHHWLRHGRHSCV